jgi:hypothetical protein
MRGSCDCCNAQDVELSFCIVTGIETYACAKCRGIDEDEEMTIDDRIEANANLTLWCVHILGSDDVLAAPSHAAAVAHAHELNQAVFGSSVATDDVMCFAYAAPWPHSSKAHADDLEIGLPRTTPTETQHQ